MAVSDPVYDIDKEQSTSSPQRTEAPLSDEMLAPICLHSQDDEPQGNHPDQPCTTDSAERVPGSSTSGQMLDQLCAQTAAVDKDGRHSPATNEDAERSEEFPPKGSMNSTLYFWYLYPPPTPSDGPHPQEKHIQNHQQAAETAGIQDKNARELASTELPAAVVWMRKGFLVFKPEGEPREVQAVAEEFLAKYPPSRVTTVNSRPVHWISVRGPIYDNDEDDKDNKDDSKDLDGLLKAWDVLQKSGQSITYQKIKELAVTYRCLSGKWMIWKDMGPKIDCTWERVFRGVIAGQLGRTAKVSSAFGRAASSSDRHIICIYNEDFTDEADVRQLERKIRQQGIHCQMMYKPDVFTHLGVYQGNSWGLWPTLYTSTFDIHMKCSTFVSSLHSQDDETQGNHPDQPCTTDSAERVPGSSTSGQMLDQLSAQTAAVDKDGRHSPATNEDMERFEEFPPGESTNNKTGSEPCSQEKDAQSHQAAETVWMENGWLGFEPKGEPKKVQAEAEEFLAKYPPSKLMTVDSKQVFEICVDGPTDGEEDDDDDDADLDGLMVGWDVLQESGQSITYQKIKELAVTHRCLSGKWIIAKETGPKIDCTWERVFRAVIAGQLGEYANVTSAFTKVNKGSEKHVISIHNDDFTDDAEVRQMERKIRQLGILCQLTYKPDVFTHLGVYRGNPWGLWPTLYTSTFDIRRKCSMVVTRYEEQ